MPKAKNRPKPTTNIFNKKVDKAELDWYLKQEAEKLMKKKPKFKKSVRQIKREIDLENEAREEAAYQKAFADQDPKPTDFAEVPKTILRKTCQ